jgi:hypothetical protein
MMKRFPLVGAVALLAIAIGCGGEQSSPVTPSPAGPITTDADANPDGSNLKVSAPGLVSPANNATLDQFTVTLTISAAQAKFVTGVALAYRIQLLDEANNVVREQRGTSLTFAITDNLDVNKLYRYRARAESGTSFGPWSATWSFRTPDIPEGYMRAGELYDPLNNGKTVGAIIGPVTLTPEGARIDDFTGHIRYQLPQTITAAEFSMLVKLRFNTDGGKTKVMSMSEGLADITTNDRRFTIEKRGDPPGVVAWRMITRDDQIDTEGAERVEVRFNDNVFYLWQVVYGNNQFRLRIYEGGAGGRLVYDHAKHYDGVYDPDPHFAFVGSPIGRGGAPDASVEGMVVRQVWLSSRPRPAFANK